MKKQTNTENTQLQETPKTQERSWADFLTDTSQNVSNTERIASVATGAGLVAYGIKRSDWLGALLSIAGGTLAYRGATGHCQIYDALDVDMSDKSLLSKGKAKAKNWLSGDVEVVKSVTIDKSPAELYSFWREFENLPKFMDHLESVEVQDKMRSHWTAKAPLGSTVSWDAVITEDKENELIAWSSYGDAQIPNRGKVEFLPTVNRGTEVKVTVKYEPPAGKLSQIAAYFLTEEPNNQVEDDLRRFKRLMETGLIISVEGQPSGRSEKAEEVKNAKQAAA